MQVQSYNKIQKRMMENEHFTTLKLLYVFIKSVSFLQTQDWTISTNERPVYKPHDQSEGLLHAAVNNVSQ